MISTLTTDLRSPPCRPTDFCSILGFRRWSSPNRRVLRPMTPAATFCCMDQKLPLIGMAKERARIDHALAKGESVLVLGTAGGGKTRLLQDATAAHSGILYVTWKPTLHGLLIAMARALIAVGHTEFLRRARAGQNPETWLAGQTSIHLKGLLWNAFEASPVPMILDGVAGAGFPTYRFLQRIYHTRGMVLLAASRDAIGMGALARLFWNPAKIVNVLPLNERDAAQLFEAAADCFQLRNLDLADFRDKVLENARGNPGQIIEMCRMATQPQYLRGRYVKFAPLRIDTMIKFAR